MYKSIKVILSQVRNLNQALTLETQNKRFYVKHDPRNNPLPHKSVCGNQEPNEGNRIEFLLAYFYDVLNGNSIFEGIST